MNTQFIWQTLIITMLLKDNINAMLVSVYQ